MICLPAATRRTIGLECNARGFTMIELITVIVVTGILTAVGVARFTDSSAFSTRAYGDQAKALIRYGQKLAIAQNRAVYVRGDGNSFALCYAAACAAGNLALAPGGNNSGSSGTKSYCLMPAYVASWMCEGKPTGVTAPGIAGGSFYFDAAGRPFNAGDAPGASSSFARTVLNFSGNGGSTYSITIEAETGYVY